MQLKTKSKTEQLNMNRKQKYTKLKSLLNEVRPNPKCGYIPKENWMELLCGNY